MSRKFAILAGLVANMRGATMISIDAETNVELLGGAANAMKGRVTKRHIGHNVMIFQNKRSNAYANMVQRRLDQEGKDPAAFELSPRKWGTRVKDMPFVVHNGNFYFEVIFLHPGKTEYFFDGQPIDPKDIIGLKAPAEAAQGGLDNKVVLRDFRCDNICAITIDHQRVVL